MNFSSCVMARSARLPSEEDLKRAAAILNRSEPNREAIALTVLSEKVLEII